MLENKENKIIKIGMYICAIFWAVLSIAPLKYMEMHFHFLKILVLLIMKQHLVRLI